MKHILFGLLAFGFSATAFAEPNCSGAYDGTDYYNFKEACFKHDVCYSEGKLLGLTKKHCDNVFYNHMSASCIGRTFICDIAAKVYKSAVDKMSQSVFDNASTKSDAAIEFIKKSDDEKAVKALLELIDQRLAGQKAWTKKYRECRNLRDESPERNKCDQQRSAIKVPDIPHEFHMGDCNILGIGWKNGHRTENTYKMSKLTGVPVDVIRSDAGGDACKGLYPESDFAKSLED